MACVGGVVSAASVSLWPQFMFLVPPSRTVGLFCCVITYNGGVTVSPRLNAVCVRGRGV